MKSIALGLALALTSYASASIAGVYNDLMKRAPFPGALPGHATAAELRWQPALDFDRDSCYNAPAIGPDGQIIQGLGHGNIVADGCHDQWYLDNNNVYVRTRCNDGWCAYVYDYYFDNAFTGQHLDIGSRQPNWQHIVIFTHGHVPKFVSISRPQGYDIRTADEVQWDGSHPKIVYQENSINLHGFRFANQRDVEVLNRSGTWFRGALVDYYIGFPGNLRDKLMNFEFGFGAPAIKDANFKRQLDLARLRGDNVDLAPGFNSGKDI